MITQYIVTEGAALRIRDANDREGLVNAILKLHDSPELRMNQSREMAAVAHKNIPSWDDRIKTDITLMELIAAGKPVQSFLFSNLPE